MIDQARWRQFRRALPVLALAWCMAGLFVTRAAGQGAGVTYLYDASGRLVGVIDPTGAAAIYQYDAVGNLLSIQRQNPGTVSVLAFTPASGAPGATITVSGTGFSSTPNQNNLSFNGTAAAVTASTATQLTTTVPMGASTGPLSVTSPNGTASSAQSFVVTAGAPSISGFTPTGGVAGTALTISGVNFDATTPTNDRTLVNATFTPVSAASTTALTTTVPSAVGSGRLTVTTPFGTAISAADLIVPPSPYTPGDVSTFARLPFATATTVTFPAANTIGLLLFDGAVGQRVFLFGNNLTITNTWLKLYDPVATEVASTILVSSYGYGYIDTQILSRTGTYTILVDPTLSYTGNVTLTLYDIPPDVTGSIVANGTPMTVTTTTPGQNALLTLNGTAGQRVALRASNVAIGFTALSIIAPDGTVLNSVQVPTPSTEIDATVLPSTGGYTVKVDPTREYTGHLDLTLYDVPPDLTGSIVPDGASVTTNITAPYQNALLTFSGTSGQRVFLTRSNNTISSSSVSIRKPDGSTLGTMNANLNTLDTQTLPVTGTYTVLIDPNYAYTGSVTLTLTYVPADVTGTIVPGGASVSVTINSPGQNALLTFSGTSGQRVFLTRSNNTISSSSVSIRKPDGSTLGSMNANFNYLDTQTLPVTGTYTVLVDPNYAYTGSVTLTLYDVPADPTATLNIGGAAVTLTTTTPGQNAQGTFSGTSGQQITVHLTGNTMGSTTVKLLKPDGSQLTSSVSSSSSFNLAMQTLPTTGTYTIKVDPTGTNVGNITVNVTSP